MVSNALSLLLANAFCSAFSCMCWGTALHGMKAFFHSLGLPLTFAELGIASPDIHLLVKKLHENKGEIIGGYYKLNSADTEKIYRLML